MSFGRHLYLGQWQRMAPCLSTGLSSNESNDGSIGNLFTAAMTTPGSYQRVYAVSRVTLGGSSLVVSGEIDAFNDEIFFQLRLLKAAGGVG
jgi:hypothetical protein